MFEKADVVQLEKFNGGDSLVVSLFLNVSPQERKRSTYLSKFKNLVKSQPEDKMSLVKEDIEKIEKFLQSERESFKKSIVLYSCTKKDLWQRYDLNMELNDLMVIDKTPYTSPLVDLLDNYQKYGVLLVDKRTARVFLVFLGDIEEYGIIHHEDVPGKHKKGGWFALAEKRYERHIEHHVKMHLKDVIDKLDDFLKIKEIKKLIVTGPDEAIHELMKMLPENIKGKIVGRAFMEKYASTEDILERIMPVIQEYEQMKKSKTLEELITRSRKNDNAVLGVDDVIKYLRNRRVMKVVIPKDFELEGSVCEGCGFSSSQKLEKCIECGASMVRVNNLLERVTEMAIESGAIVEVLKEDKDRNLLIENGVVGAFLKF